MPLTEAEQQFLEERRKGRTTIGPIIERATEADPDREAEINRLSTETGLHREVVEDDLNEARRIERLRNLGIGTLPQRAPITSDWLSNEENARVGHDDVETLENIERLTQENKVTVGDVALTLPAGALEGVGSATEGMGHLYDAYSRWTNQFFRTRQFSEYLANKFPSAKPYLLMGEDTPEPVKAALGSLEFGRSLRWAGHNIKRTAGMLDLTDEERARLGYWESVGIDISKGTGQLAGQILTYIVNPALGMSQLFGQGADQAAQRQIESGAYADSATADLAIFTGAAITAGTEKLGIDALLNRLPPKIKNRLLRNVTDLLVAGGTEALQEVGEGILHGLNEYFTTNPDAEILEGLDREALAAGGSAMVVRTIINMLTPGRGNIESINEAAGDLKSVAAQAILDQRIAFAQSSKVNQRSPEQFKEFIEGLDPDERVFIRPEALDGLEGLPDEVMGQIDGTGASVSVSMKTFLSDIATNEQMIEQIRPHISMWEGQKTLSELEAGEMSPGVKRMIDNARKRSEAMTEAEAIYEQVRDQIVGTRRQGEATARMSAQLLPAVIVAKQAELARRGKDVSIRELYEDFRVKIVGPKGEVQPGREVLSQFREETDIPNVDDIFRQPDYWAVEKGRTATMVQMTPDEYLEAAAEGFGTTVQELTSQRSQEKVDEYAEAMARGDQFPALNLDYYKGFTQEGIHRAMAAKQAGIVHVPTAIVRAVQYNPEQDFGDLKVERFVEEDGRRFRVVERAQELWIDTQRRIAMVESLRECLRAS